MNQSSYARFLNYINTIDAKSTASKLDSIEEALLNEVMVADSNGQNVLTGDLLKLEHISSQATLHGRIKNLVSSGYLNHKVDTVDGRKKFLVPTKLAFKRYEMLSKLMARAIAR
ncbi:hypothetical protein [Polynucleobacter brandtiae]|uniref:MarR family transcriptional regulator n=1 Tax=Polynucleobacter brandtiae TaxID=1938816 RepID=A0A2M8VYY9_9BURK|nr:hypothetical protein [Polynucleobacter brandtiae]PJI83087.1 hypothetical protein B0G85_0478 [Polynucleobacter brandtiae]